MKKRFISTILMIFFIYGLTYSQTNTITYYYYKGEKIPIEIDYNTISFVSNKEININTINLNLTKRLKNIEKDNSRYSSIPILNTLTTQIQDTLYIGEIELDNIATAEQYQTAINKIQDNPNILKVLPSFIYEGHKIGVSNNFYVQLKEKEDVVLLYEMAQNYGIEILGYDQLMPLWFTLSCNGSSYTCIEAANLFYESNLFENAEPEFIKHILFDTNDPLFYLQWGIKHTGQYGWNPKIDIKAEQAWELSTGKGIRVSVFDEGVDREHPDLNQNMSQGGFDCNTEQSSGGLQDLPIDKIYGGHGTACAGIIGAIQNNIIGISGVAPDVQIYPVSFQFGSSTVKQIATGMNMSWINSDIISNSWSGGSPSSYIDNAINNAFQHGREGKGTIVVFSTGNENKSSIPHPTNSNPLILAVGASSPCGERKNPLSCDNATNWGSNYGIELDIIAPGINIPTTDRVGTKGYSLGDYELNFGGTSAACPHVAGVAALILSANSKLTVKEVNDIIEKTAQKVRPDLYTYESHPKKPNGDWNKYTGYGLVDAYEAVKLAIDYGCVPNINISNPITVSKTYNVSDTITISSSISGNCNVALKANIIKLTSGFNFKALNSGKLSVKIDPCSCIEHSNSESLQIFSFDYCKFYTNKITQVLNLSEISTEQNINLFPEIISKYYKICFNKTSNVEVYVFDIQGKLIWDKKYIQTSLIKLDLKDLCSGIYIVRILSPTMNFSKKIILQ